jgi:hypothetical protein
MRFVSNPVSLTLLQRSGLEMKSDPFFVISRAIAEISKYRAHHTLSPIRQTHCSSSTHASAIPIFHDG